MLFGFLPAIVAGFLLTAYCLLLTAYCLLLTAIQTWTNIPGLKSTKLLYLVLLWVFARVLILFNPSLHIAFIMAIDLSFMPLVAYFLAKPLFKIGQYRNMIFIPVLSLMTLANLLSYLLQFGWPERLNTIGLHAMVVLTTFLVAFLGGRVIPIFTANGNKTTKVAPLKWLDISALSSLAIILIVIASDLKQFSEITAGLCFIAAILHFYRQLRVSA
jgi:uncharacterized protein involved in response to NO